MPPHQIWIWRRRFISGASSPLSDHSSRIKPRIKESVYATLYSEYNSASVREELLGSSGRCYYPCHFGRSWPGGGDLVYRLPSRALSEAGGRSYHDSYGWRWRLFLRSFFSHDRRRRYRAMDVERQWP